MKSLSHYGNKLYITLCSTTVYNTNTLIRTNCWEVNQMNILSASLQKTIKLMILLDMTVSFICWWLQYTLNLKVLTLVLSFVTWKVLNINLRYGNRYKWCKWWSVFGIKRKSIYKLNWTVCNLLSRNNTCCIWIQFWRTYL